MAGENLYLITSLPPLGELGTAPPMTASELIDHVGAAAGVKALIDVIYLAGDLIQREANLAGEPKEPSPVVLSIAQVQNEEPLPAPLPAEQPQEAPTATGIAADRIWEAYFRHAEKVARRRNNAFLAEWIAYEVALRNALAWARAKSLGLEPADYLIAKDLGSTEYDFEGVISEWSSAPNALAGVKVLDQARWDWLTEHDAWFTFSDDELAAYATKLALLHRWHRLTQAQKDGSQELTMPQSMNTEQGNQP